MTKVERMVVAGGGRYGGGWSRSRSRRRQRRLREATRMEGRTSSLFVVVVEVGSEKTAVRRWSNLREKESGCCDGVEREETMMRWRDMAREMLKRGDEVKKEKKNDKYCISIRCRYFVYFFVSSYQCY